MKRLALTLVAAGALVPSGSAMAATFDVNKLTDGAPDACDANCTLRDAVTLANGDAALDVINLPAGTIALTQGGLPDDTDVAGDIDIAQNVQINGAAGGTTIDASGLPALTRERVIHVLGGAASSELDNVTITGGQQTLTGGGGVFVTGSASLIVKGSTITGNTTNTAAGGGALVDTGNLTLLNSTVTGNGGATVTDGGGIAVATAGDLKLYSTTIAGNSAGGPGAAGNLGRAAGTGSAFNSIVANPASGANCAVTPVWANAQANLSSTADAECKFGSATVKADNIASADPLLDTLASNGGPTKTMALKAGSPAREKGTAASCIDATGAALTVDQRGSGRPMDADSDGVAACDIGAFEVPTPPAQSAGGGGNFGGGGGGGFGGPAPDRTAPDIFVSAGGGARANRIKLTITSTEDGDASATGTVALAGAAKTFRYKSAKASVKAAQKRTLTLKLGKKGVAAVKKALRRKKKVAAKVSVSVSDLAGNKRSAKKTVKLK